MPLVFRYSDPRGISEPAVLTDLGQEVVRLGTFAVAQSAEIGEAATSGVEIDDPTGSLNFVGYRAFMASETSAPSNNQLIASSIILDRHVTRGPFITGAGRRWRIDLADANWIFGLNVQVMADANRPAETAGDRLRWLLGAGRFYLHDDGHVVYPTNAMDACDYRGQNGKDVIADIALACGYNYWAQVNEALQHTELFFFDADAYYYTSTLQISNDPADVDGTTTFYPARDADMGRSPTRIAYGIYLPYANGSVYVRNDQVGQQYHYVDQVAPMANVKTRAKALAIANRMLSKANEEDDRINCAIKVPAASVNTLRHGHALRVKFLHLPGWEDWRWARVLRRSVLQEEAEGEAAYRLELELTPIAATASGSYGPNLAATSDSTGTMIYWKPGMTPPRVITPGFAGSWHFGIYNQSGVDYAGDAAENTLRVIMSGAGEVTIHTNTYGGSPRTLTTQLYHYDPGQSPEDVGHAAIGNVTTGSDIVVTLPADGFSVHYIDVTDDGLSSGGKWGFSGFDWTLTV